MMRSPNRSGFALLMTLVLITIAGLMLVGIARRSIDLASEAIDAQRRLQRRWTMQSCRSAILNQADEILLRNGSEHAPTNWISGQIQMANRSVTVTIADENAKANVGLIYQESKRIKGSARRIIADLIGPSLGHLVLLRPSQNSASRVNKAQFDSWGQVFDLGRISDPVATADLLMTETKKVSCWGNEKLNLRTASDEVLSRVARMVLDIRFASQLIKARESYFKALSEPEKGRLTSSSEYGSLVGDILSGLDLREKDRIAAQGILSDSSSVYSLWIRGDEGGTRWHALNILRKSDAGHIGRLNRFVW